MTLLGDKNVGDVVKIKESGELVNYIIVHKGLPSSVYDSSCNGVWLLRENVHSKRAFFTEPSRGNAYESSDIRAWLEGDFFNTIDEKARASIQSVKIPYTKGSGGGGKVQNGANGLSSKVFLLSAAEIGYTDRESLAIEGTKLSYFTSEASRIAKDSTDSAANWWLRSPIMSTAAHSMYIIPSGYCTDSYTSSADIGVRPAFVLPVTTEVSLNGLVGNNEPIITSDKSSGSNLGEVSAPVDFTYTVNDIEVDTVTVTEYLDDVQTRTYTVTLGVENSFEVLSDPVLFQKILNGEHTLKIIANDGTNDSAPYTVTFDKQVRTAEISLANPLPADDVIKAAVISVTGKIPYDATVEVLVTNNALDENPVWEDMSREVEQATNHVFANRTAENGFAFNFKVTVTRGESEEQGFIEKIGGAFE